ncbi:MAG: GNAT family N-acetyltransferase [Pseudonocardiales bacterium]|nr:MAG: GNAT family N-acetyltransferase [Pseudonocardiales bacterium]
MAESFVRAARDSDVAEIARIHRATWETAYRRWLPPAVLEQATPEVVAAQWRAAVVEPPTPDHRVLVATEGDATVGFAAIAPSADDDADPATGQVVTLLIEPRWGRRGHGSRLLAASVDLLRASGAATATAWIYDRDRVSLAFFAGAGWAADGAVRGFDAGGRELREVRMGVALAAG